MYFVRIDFIYKGSVVNRTRDVVDCFASAARMVNTMVKDGYTVLQVKIERCC